MSNIVVSEEQILNAETQRTNLVTNLRSIGVACESNETLKSLVQKVATSQSWLKYLDKTMSGNIYDDTLTRLSERQFYEFRNLTGVQFKNVTSIDNVCFQNCSALTYMVFNNVTNIGTNFTVNCSALEKVVIPRYNASPPSLHSTAGQFTLVDLGSIPAITSSTNLNDKLSFKYFILRKADSITTLDNTSRLSGSSPLTFVPQAQISNYEGGTNWSATSCTFLSLEGSRFEDLDWYDDLNSKCTLDGNEVEVLDDETVAIFKHTENISHCYEDGVELQDTDLVKGKTLTSTV